MGTDPRAKRAGTAGLTGFDMFRQRNALDPTDARDTDTIMNARTTGEAVIGLLCRSQTWTIIDRGAPVGILRNVEHRHQALPPERPVPWDR
jgi:putative spermidine/putrescine transport system substrate-binding protein